MKMQLKLAILIVGVIALTHFCAAAPRTYYNGDTLLRPSPINPDIPMDPRPAETITIITDPKEIAKYKREIKIEAMEYDISAPTTVSPKHSHPLNQPEKATDHNERLQQHRQRRETITDKSKSTKAPLNTETLNNKQTSEHIPTTVKQKVTRYPIKKTKLPSQSNTQSTTTSTVVSSGQIKHRQKRNDENVPTMPLIYRDENKQPKSHMVQQTQSSQRTRNDESNVSSDTKMQSTVKPQTLPYVVGQTSVKEKRDIPVPLVPKYHHPEESPKSDEQQDETTAAKTETNNQTVRSTPATEPEHTSESSMEKKQEKRTVTENIDAIQVEHLSEHHHQQHSTKQENHQEDTSSTTGPSIFMHQPVPVAELFAKGKSTEAPKPNAHHGEN